MQSETLFAIDKDGILQKVQISVMTVGSADTALRNLGRTAEWSAPILLDGDIFCAGANGTVQRAAQLGELQITTGWAPVAGPSGDPEFVPTFGQGIQRTVSFKLPGSGHLFLVGGSAPRDEVYLAYVMGGRLYRLPLGNIYEDGRVCLGNDHREWLNSQSEGPARSSAVMEELITRFDTAPYNADLLNSSTLNKAQGMFRTDIDGKPRMPDDITPYLIPLGNTRLNFLLEGVR